jgi:hypothetical protein
MEEMYKAQKEGGLGIINLKS